MAVFVNFFYVFEGLLAGLNHSEVQCKVGGEVVAEMGEGVGLEGVIVSEGEVVKEDVYGSVLGRVGWLLLLVRVW